MTIRRITRSITKEREQMPAKSTSTVGKNRRKIISDSIELSDLGCHAFKDGSIPKNRRVLSHNLSQRVHVR